MTVIITDNTPPRIRGALKRWFLEPKPNVFVGSVSKKCAEETIKHLQEIDKRWNALVIRRAGNCQGFTIEEVGTPKIRLKNLCGLQLIEKKAGLEKENTPF